MVTSCYKEYCVECFEQCGTIHNGSCVDEFYSTIE